MEILIVDDEQMSLDDLKDVVESVKPYANMDCFDNCEDAINASKIKKYDIAFLDIEMPDKNGIALAKELKDIYSRTNIVFATGYSQYALEAFCINASGYILKPARKADVINAFNNLRVPIKLKENKLNVTCFGNFEVFFGDEIIKFKRKATKELFAYLVDLKGSSANTNELCGVLFEEDSFKNKHYLRNLISDLKATLKHYKCEDVFVNQRNSFSIDPSKFECDYYRYLQYDLSAVNSYMGSYMKQYSWAEMTNGFLTTEKKNYTFA